MSQPPLQPQQQHPGYYPAPAYQPPPPSQYGYPPPARAAPNFHVSSKGMWSAKLSLRLLSMIFCIVILSIGGVVLSDLTQLDSYYDYYYGNDWDSSLGYLGFPGPILFLGPPAGIAFAWCLIESICICARGGHRGIHPGACVAIDLLLWLGFVGAAVCTSVFLPWIFSVSAIYNYPIVTFVFGIIETILHFTLFVIACCETSARNQRQSIAYVQNSTPYTVPQATSHSMAMPYAVNDQVTPILQPPVPRKPMPTTTTTTTTRSPQSSPWGQHTELHTDVISTPEMAGSPPPVSYSPGPPNPYQTDRR